MQIKRFAFLGVALLALASAPVTVFAAGNTLDVVKKRGYVQCGVSQGLPGFSNPDDKGDWTGIDVDLCLSLIHI